MHICVDNLTIIGADNGLSPGRCQAISYTITALLSTKPLETNFNQNSKFFIEKMHLKMSSAKQQLFCLCLNVFKHLRDAKKIVHTTKQENEQENSHTCFCEEQVVKMTISYTKQIGDHTVASCKENSISRLKNYPTSK